MKNRKRQHHLTSRGTSEVDVWRAQAGERRRRRRARRERERERSGSCQEGALQRRRTRGRRRLRRRRRRPVLHIAPALLAWGGGRRVARSTHSLSALSLASDLFSRAGALQCMRRGRRKEEEKWRRLSTRGWGGGWGDGEEARGAFFLLLPCRCRRRRRRRQGRESGRGLPPPDRPMEGRRLCARGFMEGREKEEERGFFSGLSSFCWRVEEEEEKEYSAFV